MGNYGRDNRSGGGRSFGGRSFSRDNRGSGRGGDRQMHQATCDNCGKNCEVPFRPTSGKPVYCSDCFEKMGGRSDRQDRSDRPSFRQAPRQDNSQLDAINQKLDKIIKLLEPKIVEEVKVEAPRIKKVVATKTSKVKKVKKSPAKKE